MIKKCVSFFAEGGATVSWFTIQYPDPKGTARGQFGDSHCMFDCKYNLYNPRLDAITHYHLVNAICVKKFVEEKHYAGGAQAYLFRDDENRCLQAMWLDDKRQDVFVPLTADRIQLIHIDGTQQDLHCTNGGVTLTLSEDPVLLLYDNESPVLAQTLREPALSLAGIPTSVTPGATTTFTLVGRQLAVESVRVICPPLWKASSKQAGDGRVEVRIQAPQLTTAREAQVQVQLFAAENVIAELQVPIGLVR